MWSMLSSKKSSEDTHKPWICNAHSYSTVEEGTHRAWRLLCNNRVISLWKVIDLSEKLKYILVENKAGREAEKTSEVDLSTSQG